MLCTMGQPKSQNLKKNLTYLYKIYKLHNNFLTPMRKRVIMAIALVSQTDKKIATHLDPPQNVRFTTSCRIAKMKLYSYIAECSLKNVCYSAGLVLSFICVIHARKGRIITASVLTVIAEAAIFLGNKKTVPHHIIPNPISNAPLDLSPSEIKEKAVEQAIKQEVLCPSIPTVNATQQETEQTSLYHLAVLLIAFLCASLNTKK